jgi:hypothetical protein
MQPADLHACRVQPPLERAIKAKETVKSRMPLNHSDNKKIRQDLSGFTPEQRMQNAANIKATLLPSPRSPPGTQKTGSGESVLGRAKLETSKPFGHGCLKAGDRQPLQVERHGEERRATAIDQVPGGDVATSPTGVHQHTVGVGLEIEHRNARGIE